MADSHRREEMRRHLQRRVREGLTFNELVVSVITDPAVIRRILEHLKLPTEPLPLAPPRAPPQPSLPW